MTDRDESPETEALDAGDVPTEAMPAVGSAGVPTEALEVADAPALPPTRAAVDGPALPYDPGGSITELIAGPLAAGAGAAVAADDEPAPAIESRRARARAEAPRRPGILVIVAIALGAVLALVALFLLGTRIPEWTAAPQPTPAASAPAEPSATPSPTPEPSTAPPRPTGPAPAGVAEWTALAGGECLDPWVDPWQLEYTVVDCAAPHPAQLTWRGPISDDPAAAYPGEEALVSQVAIVCGAPTAIDLAAAGAYADIQVQAAYPVSEEAWAAGERDWFCFVTRSSGEPLTGSVAPAR